MSCTTCSGRIVWNRLLINSNIRRKRLKIFYDHVPATRKQCEQRDGNRDYTRYISIFLAIAHISLLNKSRFYSGLYAFNLS